MLDSILILHLSFAHSNRKIFSIRIFVQTFMRVYNFWVGWQFLLYIKTLNCYNRLAFWFWHMSFQNFFSSCSHYTVIFIIEIIVSWHYPWPVFLGHYVFHRRRKYIFASQCSLWWRWCGWRLSWNLIYEFIQGWWTSDSSAIIFKEGFKCTYFFRTLWHLFK